MHESCKGYVGSSHLTAQEAPNVFAAVGEATSDQVGGGGGGQSAPYLPFAICQSPVGAAPRHRHYCIPQTEIQRPDAHEDAYRAPCHRLAAERPSICTGLAHVVGSELPPRHLPTRLPLLSVPKDSRL